MERCVLLQARLRLHLPFCWTKQILKGKDLELSRSQTLHGRHPRAGSGQRRDARHSAQHRGGPNAAFVGPGSLAARRVHDQVDRAVHQIVEHIGTSLMDLSNHFDVDPVLFKRPRGAGRA